MGIFLEFLSSNKYFRKTNDLKGKEASKTNDLKGKEASKVNEAKYLNT